MRKYKPLEIFEYLDDRKPYFKSNQIAKAFNLQRKEVKNFVLSNLSEQDYVEETFGDTKSLFISKNGVEILAKKYDVPADNLDEIISLYEQMEDFIAERNDVLNVQGIPKSDDDFRDTVYKYAENANERIFKNEYDMIYIIVLGHTSKKHRELYNIDKSVSVKSTLSEEELKTVDDLENLDIGLLKQHKYDFFKRKHLCSTYYFRKYMQDK